jgi:hypothetical protein
MSFDKFVDSAIIVILLYCVVHMLVMVTIVEPIVHMIKKMMRQIDQFVNKLAIALILLYIIYLRYFSSSN